MSVVTIDRNSDPNCAGQGAFISVFALSSDGSILEGNQTDG